MSIDLEGRIGKDWRAEDDWVGAARPPWTDKGTTGVQEGHQPTIDGGGVIVRQAVQVLN
jgi:hypothetical protein